MINIIDAQAGKWNTFSQFFVVHFTFDGLDRESNK